MFSSFFDCWLAQQHRDLHSLHSTSTSPASTEEQTQRLVDQVVGHYEYYYRAKSALAHRDVLSMFTPTWTSSTDNLFLWVGGWRPSMAFHVLYSKCGIQLEEHMAGLTAAGLPAAAQDLGDLSLEQLERVDALHRGTIGSEKEISEQEAQVQESVASVRLVDISHEITELMRNTMEDGGLVETAMEPDMMERREKMTKVLNRADTLRLATLKSIVQILTPMQAVHFLIAAAELLLRVHEFGKSVDIAAGIRSPSRAN